MLTRSCCRCVSRTGLQYRPVKLPITRTQARHYATPSGSAPAQATTKAGMLAPFVNELDKIAPSVDLHGDQIRIIQTPSEFYEALKVGSLLFWSPNCDCGHTKPFLT